MADGEVVGYLTKTGYVVVEFGQDFGLFERADGRRLNLRTANVHGHVPEAIVNDAFDAAALDPPNWHVFWCD